jgi:hypothetical protein
MQSTGRALNGATAASKHDVPWLWDADRRKDRPRESEQQAQWRVPRPETYASNITMVMLLRRCDVGSERTKKGIGGRGRWDMMG